MCGNETSHPVGQRRNHRGNQKLEMNRNENTTY